MSILATARPSGGLFAGLRIGVLVRNSTKGQIGNWASLEQESGLDRLIEREGGELVVYDEQGTSGRDLAKRAVARGLLDDVTSGALQGIAAYDIKRLTRDEFGADAGTIAKRLAHARALLVTMSRVYRLWEKDDKAIFRFEAAMSGRDVEDIRDTFWRGIFARAAREPFWIGRPALGYTTRIVEVPGTRPGERTRIKRVPVKDPEQAPLMADLIRWLDECAVLGDVARRVSGRYGELLAARARRGFESAGWRTYNLMGMLDNPVYWGRFVLGRSTTRESVVWDTDDRRGRADDYAVEAPDLAYWTRARARGWRQKFARRPGVPAKRARTHPHPLLGVLACPECHSLLIGNGQAGYACPLKGTVNCGSPECITERAARRVLRTLLPDLLTTSGWVAEATRRAAADSGAAALKGLQSTLSVLQDKLETMTEEWYGEDAPGAVPRPVREKMVALQAEIEAQEAAIAEEEAGQQTSEGLRRACEELLDDPVGAFDALGEDAQAAFYRLLLADARIKGTGHGAGRRHAWASYTDLLTNTVVSAATSGSTCRTTVRPSGRTGLSPNLPGGLGAAHAARLVRLAAALRGGGG